MSPVRSCFILNLLVLLAAFSCKSDEPAPKISTTVCFLQVIAAPQILTEIYFKEDNHIDWFKMQQDPYIYQTEFVYDSKNDLIIKSYFMRAAGLFSGFASIAAEGTYTYDSQGNLTGRDSTVMDNTNRWSYEYNSTNQLISSSMYFKATGAELLLTTTNFQYPNDSTHNPSQITDSSGIVRLYEYDTHPNPAKLLGFSSIVPDNNIARQTVSGSPSVVYDYTYQYNENGYPLSFMIGTEKTEYTYDCKVITQ